MALTLCALGHVATARELLDHVHGQHSVVDIYATSRDVVRPRRGLYACAHLTERELMALSAGGYLDCVTVLDGHGIALFNDGRVHVRVPTHAGRTSPCTGGGLVVRRHWTPLRLPLASPAAAARAVREHRPAPSRASVSLADAFIQAEKCVPRGLTAAVRAARLEWLSRHA